MDGNKDESEKCINISIKSYNSEDFEKALRFATKSDRLYPSNRAKELVKKIEERIKEESEEKEMGEKKEGGDSTHLNGHATHNDTAQDNTHDASHKHYTHEQLTAVKKIKKCKDYYEILAVSKDCQDSELKKAYRKLALQFHPDKNKAPGATEAFKAIGNAYSILSDTEKRRKYDLYGPEEEQTNVRHRHRYNYSRGFEADISAEELFNAFFGGGFPSDQLYTRRTNGRTYHHQHHFQTRERTQNEGGMTLLLQLAPILMLVALSVLSSLFVSDPTHSLHRSHKFNVERRTSNLRIPYFVKKDFHIEHKGSIRRIENQVENEYISDLRSRCYQERSMKETMLWRARHYSDAKLYERAQNYKAESCDKIQQIYGG